LGSEIAQDWCEDVLEVQGGMGLLVARGDTGQEIVEMCDPWLLTAVIQVVYLATM